MGATDTLDALAQAGGSNQWGADANRCAALDNNEANVTTGGSSRLETVISNSSENGSINSVTVRTSCYKNNNPIFGNAYIRPGLRTGGTWYEGADQLVTTEEAYYENVWTTNPGGGSWTWTQVNALDAGGRCRKSGGWGNPTFYSDHVQIVVDYNAYPDVTGLSAGANATGTQIDSNTVNIDYEIFHVDDNAVTITARYREGGAGSWIDLTNTSGDVGTVNANSSTTDRTLVWDAKTQLGAGKDANFEIRIIATDTNHTTQKDSVVTTSFLIDTQKPTVLANLTVLGVGQDTVRLQWSSATEAHFDHYEIWYGSDSSGVAQRNLSASEWDTSDSTNLGTITTTTTTISGLSVLTKYYFQIWAVDQAGNEMTTSPVSTTTLTTAVPQVTGFDPQSDIIVTQINSDDIQIGYEVYDADDSTVTITLEMKLSTDPAWDSTWTIMKPHVSGDTGVVVGDQSANDTIIWDVRGHLGQVNRTAYIRVIAVDSAGNSDTSTSTSFGIDTDNPTFSATLNTGAVTSASVALSWTSAASDPNFDHYEIWYGTTLSDVQARNNAAEWDDDPDDSNLGTASTTTTTITGLLANTLYYFKIWAVDVYGNETTLTNTNTTTAATTNLQITDIEDNTLINGGAWANYNYGNSITRGGATVGRIWELADWGWHNLRTLVKINLDTIPSGATIDTCYFQAVCHSVNDNNNRTINCRQVLVDWTEGTKSGATETGSSCWNRRVYNTTSWGGAGCDQDNTDRSSSVLASTNITTTGTYTWGSTELKQLVQDWLIGTVSNQGLLFESETSAEANNDIKEFYSAQHSGSQPRLIVDYKMDNPVLSGISDSVLLTAAQPDPDSVTIRYELLDANHDSAIVSAQYKYKNGSWTNFNTSYTVGDISLAANDSIPADNGATDRTIRWAVRSQFGSIDTTFSIRLIATDPWGAKDTTGSAEFGVDLRAPIGLGSFSVSDSSSYWMDCSWSSVTTESNFDHYEIWYGSNKSDVENRSGTALEWDGADHGGMLDVTTTLTKITNLSSSTKYYFKIWAIDDMGNEATTTLDSATTLEDPIPTVTGWDQAALVDAVQLSASAVEVGFQVIDIDDDSADITLQYYKVAGGSWTNATTMSGDTGWVSTGESVYDTILWDVSADLPGTTDEPYKVRIIAVDDTSFTDTTESAQFDVDLVSPTGLGSLVISTIDANSATLTWTAASDNNFNHYEIWYGTTLPHVQGRGGTANEWDEGNDPNLDTAVTATTTITSLIPSRSYFFKIWAIDEMGNESTLTYVNGNTAASNDPTVTGPSGAALVAASQVSTVNVNIDYEVSDVNSPTVTITSDYQIYGGSGWTALTTTSGDIGSSIAVGTGKQIVWNVSTDLAPADSAYKIRVTANDAKGKAIHTAESDTFTIDVKAPASLASLAVSDTLGTQLTLTWTAATDRNFNHYEIWYGTSRTDVLNRSGTATEWDNSDDGNLNTATTATTTVTGLTSNTNYYWKIWAIDNIGNETTIADINVATKNMVTPQWSRTSLGDIQGGAIAENVIYIGSGANVYKLIAFNTSTGATNWTYSTSAYGTCNTPSYIYSNGKYKVVASAGNYVVGRQDNGGNSSQLFSPINLGAAAGNPYISPDDSAFYVVYGNNLAKRNLYTGSQIWAVTISNLSKDADLVVFDDVVYVAATDGMVYKRNVSDGSPGQSFNASNSVDLPLLVQDGALYVTPSSNTVYSVSSSNLTLQNWTCNVTDNITGAAFIAPGSNDLYVAVSDSVKKINASTGVQSMAYNAGATVSSGPIPYNSHVYFGRNNSRYFAITTAGASVVKWPYSVVSGDASSGPWIDIDNSRVIFGSTGGNMDAFTLESTAKTMKSKNSNTAIQTINAKNSKTTQ